MNYHISLLSAYPFHMCTILSDENILLDIIPLYDSSNVIIVIVSSRSFRKALREKHAIEQSGRMVSHSVRGVNTARSLEEVSRTPGTLLGCLRKDSPR